MSYNFLHYELHRLHTDCLSEFCSTNMCLFASVVGSRWMRVSTETFLSSIRVFFFLVGQHSRWFRLRMRFLCFPNTCHHVACITLEPVIWIVLSPQNKEIWLLNASLMEIAPLPWTFRSVKYMMYNVLFIAML